MLAKAGKSSDTNVGEFCSVIFAFFYGVLDMFEVRHMRLSASRKLIFGVHGVQEMFFRLAKKILSTG